VEEKFENDVVEVIEELNNEDMISELEQPEHIEGELEDLENFDSGIDTDTQNIFDYEDTTYHIGDEKKNKKLLYTK